MPLTMKIELDDSYLVLPYLRPRSIAPSSPDEAPESSMIYTAPSRTMSIASTLPSSTASVRSSLDLDRPSSQSPDTTALKGRIILTTTKSTKISSLALTLNGSTHIAFLGSGKRAHYSRHHIRSQKYVVEPSESEPTLLDKDVSISYPFTIFVPNNLPVSVTTPQGGTIYRLTAVVTLAKSAGLMSFLSSGSTFTTSSTVQIYRSSRSRCLASEQIPTNEESESEEEEGSEGEPQFSQRRSDDPLNPAAVSHTWPGQLEAHVSIPYVELPPESRPDLHLRVRILRENLAVKSFQAALWERVIFRVQKAGAPIKSKKHIIGVRERIVSAQRCDAGWVNDTITSQVPHTFEKVVLFSIPGSLRKHNELYTSRSCNPSTFDTVSKLKKRHLKEDEEIKDSEFGEIHIEVQHFIRYSIFATGWVDSRGKTIQTSLERVLGETPVIVRGLPTGPECDLTGLPSYLYSFSTSRVSYEEARDYEIEATGAISPLGEGNLEGEGSSGPIYGDYENDDAFMAIMGFRGSRTPPSYEESLGRPSLEASISELQNVLPSAGLVSYTDAVASEVLGVTR
ncbi:hypothetical protein CPC16_003710 [Podila verticillata]|nr:hypothetical protein BGZ52_001609 [Haplosporangium bisporale]KAF9391996.1 hypothetical protein CPC16_003710 [Podila verticillata]KAI9233897.1 MAG: hypothetical protein BYD32DRAFT_424820 [Podila humilis]KFH73113.1 hypothetical protein MVEG_00336 [Podila verticillata NRRL 6337]